MSIESGMGSTFVIGASDFTGGYTEFRLSFSRDVIDTSHIGLAAQDGVSYRTFAPGLSGGTAEVDFLFDGDNPPPIDETAKTLTVTFADSSSTFINTAGCTLSSGSMEINSDVQKATLSTDLSGNFAFSTE